MISRAPMVGETMSLPKQLGIFGINLDEFPAWYRPSKHRKDAEEEAHGGCFWHHRALRAEAALAAAEEESDG